MILKLLQPTIILNLCFMSVLMVHGFLDSSWDLDIYCGRHWDDIVTPSTVASPVVTRRSALLVLYEPKCEREIVQTENLIETQLPSSDIFVFGKYDTVTTPKHIWYNVDAIDDLKERYKPKNCPEYLFFKEGSTVYNPEVYDKSMGMRVLDWIWGKMEVEFTIINHRQNTITVDVRGYKMLGFVIEPGRQNTFTTHLSAGILITDAELGAFVHGFFVETEITSIVIRNSMQKSTDKNTWYRERLIEAQEMNTHRRTWLWDLAAIYLRNFKQPVLLPSFTKDGYKKIDIPRDLYDEMIKFYWDNQFNRISEYHKVEPAINEREVKCSMVYLSEKMIQKIGVTLKPLLEEWSGRELELTRLYGIREYHRGNVLRDHVDRINTHVISAILQIHKELDDQPDWELEIITFDGKRKNVTLEPGQMLFYESAILIHGRPFPFQGKVFANAFLHYRPVNDWTWDVHPDGHWFTHDGHPKEFLDQLSTANTYMKNSRFSDEL